MKKIKDLGLSVSSIVKGIEYFTEIFFKDLKGKG
jgi:hypothetical protein